MALGAYAARAAVDWERRSTGLAWSVADGSVVKIDLSGFTRLSERLARSELTGAENLNTVLNDVFVVLIDEILTRGGDVLQFGGDALLVWFEGNEHEARAVAACRAMQRRIGEHPAERTPAGPVRLRMSAAVASGPLVLTVVGEDHRELLTLGPVATRVELLEKQARSGEILLDTATASRLPASCVVAAAAGVWRCRGLPPALPVARTRQNGSGAGEFVPPDVRALLAAGTVPGEHRRAAVAFVGISGTDALIASGDTGAAVERVAAVAAAIDEAVRATKVAWTATDLLADGAVFLLFAGAPVTREGDEERMLRACRLVAERCADLGVRIGAHAGRVFAADVGHPERRTYAVIGDTTNLAARLMHRATPGAVLVTDELFARSDRDHVIDWAETFFVKGRRRGVLAGSLGARTQAAARRRTHDLPLIGRAIELQRLTVLVDALAGRAEDSGSGLTVALVAEAGSGKSRLVEEIEMLAPHKGLTVLKATATALDADSPYAALQQAIRAALGITDDTPPATARLATLAPESAELIPLLGLPLGLDLGTTPRVDALDPRFVEGLRNELLADVLVSAAPSPLLVIGEDLHDLDRASTGLLDACARRAAPGVLAVLVSSRSALDGLVQDAGSWEELHLDPLRPELARQLALAAMSDDGALSDDELARRVEESGGNPLFLRELVAFSATSDGTLPASAEEVVAARIDTLDPSGRQLLRDASVAGPVASLSDLASVLGDRTVADPARWAGLGDFVVVNPAHNGSSGQRLEPQVRFRHDVYRRCAYDGLAVSRRRALHTGLADHLIATADSGSAAATIAVHLHEAQRHDDAWQWALRAARGARDTGALHDAVSLYVRAIDAGSHAGVAASDLAVAREELGDAAELIGRYDVADKALMAAARVGPPAVVGRRLVKRAEVLERLGRYRLALGLLTRAERRIAAADPAPADRSPSGGWTALALRRSSVLHRLGRLRAAYDVAQEVAVVTERSTTAEGRGDRARALLRLEMIASEAGWPERFDRGTEALAAFDGLDEDRDLACLLGNLGVTAWDAEDWSAARQRYEEAVAVYHRAGDVVGAAIAANNAGEILCEQGHAARAKEAFEQARRIFRAAGHAFGVAATASSLGRIAARDGDPELAATLLEEAFASLTAMGSTVFAADARVRQVEAALLAGRPDVTPFAREVLDETAAAEVGSVLAVTAARYLAVATARAGDLPEARRLAESALAMATDRQAAHEESLSLDTLAGLALLSGQEPDPELIEKRDLLWDRLGVVEAPVYAPIPRAGSRVPLAAGQPA